MENVYTNFEKIITDASHKYFEKEFKPMRYLCFDWQCFQDFKLGALLSIISSEHEYQYILKHINDYTSGYFLEVMSYFKDLQYQEENIQQYLTDESNIENLCVYSPMTSLFTFLEDFIKLILHHNQISDVHDLNITINTEWFELPDFYKKRLIKMFKNINKKINVKFSYGKISQKDKEFYMKHDLYFIYDIAEFFRNMQIMKWATEEGLFMYKKIFAFHVADKDKVVDDENKMKKIFKDTEACLNLLCDFQYIDRFILTEYDNTQ